MNKKTVLGALVGAAVLLGSFGTGAAITASAAGESVYADNSRVYTQEQFITYEAGATYELDVCLSSTVGIASFQMEFYMPEYTEIVEVRETLAGMEYVQVMGEDKKSLVINGTSFEDRTEGVLFTVVYTLTEENGSGTPYGGMQQATNTEYNYVEGIYTEFGVINVEKEEETTRLKGDMNEDGEITLEDLLIMQRSLIDSNNPLTAEQTEYADINEDGRVDLLDCQYMQGYLVGRLGSLENVGGSGDNNGNEGGNNGNEGDDNGSEGGDDNVTDPVDPETLIATYALVVNDQTVDDCTLAFSAGDTVVKFMETYKVYDNVAYSEIFVYTYTDDGETVMLTSDTLLQADAYYRVVLTGGMDLGGSETDEEIEVYAQVRVDGVIYDVENKRFNEGDTVFALRDAFTVKGYTIQIFSDEGYTVEMTEEEMSMTLEAGRTYYISRTSMESVDPVEPEYLYAHITLVADENEEELTYTFTDGATVADLQNYYKGYYATSYDLATVYGYTADGMMTELSSADLLVANGRYRVELSYTIKDEITTAPANENQYTNVDDPELILVLNESTNVAMVSQGPLMEDGSEIVELGKYTSTVTDDGMMIVEIASSINTGTTVIVQVNLIDKTFTM